MSNPHSEYNWRFSDALAANPQPTPIQWIEHGQTESLTETQLETHTVPILIRIGVRLAGIWAEDGTLIEGPVAEEPAARVLYVTPDGTQAHERIIPGSRSANTNTFRPNQFVAAAAPAVDDFSPVPDEKQPLYRRLAQSYQAQQSPDVILDEWIQEQQSTGGSTASI